MNEREPGEKSGYFQLVFLKHNKSSYYKIWCTIKRLLTFDSQILLAIPICTIIIVLFVIEVFLYIIVRFAGRFAEKWCTRPSVRHLIRRMLRAEDYETYAKCAKSLDEITGRVAWKKDDLLAPPSTYDPELLQRRIAELRFYQYRNDYYKLWECLQLCLETQLHHTLHPLLYSMTYIGTKYLIEEFHGEVLATINFLTLAVKQEQIKDDDLIWKLSHLYKAFGATGLVFSGGAMLGLHHIGLLEILIEMNLFPKVISGTSAGAIVAAFACTRSDSDILEFLRDPEKMSIFRKPFDPNNCFSRLINLIRYGYSVNCESWLSLSEKLFKTMTFREAYMLTGRVLNVSVSTSDGIGEDSVVLNYRNAPNVLITTAVLASSAFPYLGCPTHLLEKDTETGVLYKSKEYSQRFYQDGSLRGDVPLDCLRLDWGVKYIVVSQVNPHVYPFLDLRSHGSPGQPLRGWSSAAVWRGGFPLAVLEIAFKEHLRFLLRLLALLEIVPSLNGIDIRHVALQRYGGDLNISPSRLYWPHIRVMNNIPSRMLQWYLQIGRQMVFPKIWLLRSRIHVEQALEALKTTTRFYRKSYHS